MHTQKEAIFSAILSGSAVWTQYSSRSNVSCGNSKTTQRHKGSSCTANAARPLSRSCTAFVSLCRRLTRDTKEEKELKETAGTYYLSIWPFNFLMFAGLPHCFHLVSQSCSAAKRSCEEIVFLKASCSRKRWQCRCTRWGVATGSSTWGLPDQLQHCRKNSNVHAYPHSPASFIMWSS